MQRFLFILRIVDKITLEKDHVKKSCLLLKFFLSEKVKWRELASKRRLLSYTNNMKIILNLVKIFRTDISLMLALYDEVDATG